MYNQLYNGILRGFGNCGEVKEGIEFGSEAFWKSISALTVADRVAKSKNMFSSTVHVLASSIKKLQVVPPSPPLPDPPRVSKKRMLQAIYWFPQKVTQRIFDVMHCIYLCQCVCIAGIKIGDREEQSLSRLAAIFGAKRRSHVCMSGRILWRKLMNLKVSLCPHVCIAGARVWRQRAV